MPTPTTPVMLIKPLLNPVGRQDLAFNIGKGLCDAVYLYGKKLYYFNHKIIQGIRLV